MSEKCRARPPPVLLREAVHSQGAARRQEMAAACLRALGALAHTRTHARRRGRFADNAPEWTPALRAACGHEDHDADDGVFCMAFADLVTHFRSLEARLSLKDPVDERPACSRVVVIVVSRRRLAACDGTGVGRARPSLQVPPLAPAI